MKEKKAEFDDTTCGIEDGLNMHVVATLTLLTGGEGFPTHGCADAYRALVEVADYIRERYNHSPYQATGILAQQEAAARVRAAGNFTSPEPKMSM